MVKAIRFFHHPKRLMMHRIFSTQKRVLNQTFLCTKAFAVAPCSEDSFLQATNVSCINGLGRNLAKLSVNHPCTKWKSSLRAISNTGRQNIIRLSSSVSNDEGYTSGENDGKHKKDIHFDALGAWDNRIDLPIQMDASIKQGAPIPKIVASDVGCSSLIGKRTYQEDRYVVEDLPGNILCTAVFDGHGGSECSEYCSQNLKDVLVEHLQEHKDLEAVLHHTFLALHSGYAKWVEQNQTGGRSGTTAAVCLLRGGVELAVGHVGDSRVTIYRSGISRDLTQDHCPSRLAEKERILQSGGRVSVDNIGRHMVNETLSMSRSLGDLHLKSYGVIPLPDTRTLRVKHGKDAFLLIVTDGINFVLHSEEACKVVNHSDEPYQAAEHLTEQALGMSSEDNLTALVVPFGSWGKYTKSASMFYSFGIGRDMNKSSRFG